MNKLYLVLSKTNTKMGSLLRKVTRYEYNHISVSLEKNLSQMYSFSRYKMKKPFKGGFVEESMRRYLVNNKDLELIVFTIPLDDKAYDKVNDFIESMTEEKDIHRYSFKEAILTYIPFVNYNSLNNYTCLTFAIRILEEAKIIPIGNNIKTIKQLHMILSDYKNEFRIIPYYTRKKYLWNEDRYLNKY